MEHKEYKEIMLSEPDESLVNDLIDLCKKHGFTGFAGCFRVIDGRATTLHLEAPGYIDGKMLMLRKGILDLIGGTGTMDIEGLYTKK